MKLSAYMLTNKITPRQIADLVGDVSISGVIKWMRDERVPRPEQMRRIHEVTNGEVTPNDFVLPPARPLRSDERMEA